MLFVRAKVTDLYISYTDLNRFSVYEIYEFTE